MAGLHLGAGQPDRADAAVHVAARFGFAGAAFVGLFFLLFPRQLLAIFGMHDPAVVEIGVQLLRVLSVSGLMISVALTFTGGLQGTGDTKSPLYISIISQMLGIPPEDLQHIFEPGRRGRNVGSISGTGIGLAGACQIVRQHGGTIDVRSDLGRGSTFIVRLPLMHKE